MELTVTNASLQVRISNEHVDLFGVEPTERGYDMLSTRYVLRMSAHMAANVGDQLIRNAAKVAKSFELGESPYAERCAKLVTDIEDLAAGVMLSDRALNVFRTPHVVFANGAIKQEGAPIDTTWEVSPDPAIEATSAAMVFERTLAAVKAYRDERSPDGPAWLTWRHYPEVEQSGDGRLKLYLRLSFDPSPLEPAA